jgi:uncharacterized protein
MNFDQLIEQIEGGDIAAVEAAVRAEPAVVGQVVDSTDQPLHIACWQKRLAIAGLLVGYGADVNAQGDNGQTPLNYAVREGDERSIPLAAALLRVGADPEIRDRAKRTVEERAKIELDEGLASVLDLIRRRGQKARPAHGSLLPFIAAGDVMGVAHALKDKTATASADALHAACARGDVAIVALLLGYGVDVTAPDALHLAARNRTLDSAAIVGLLLAAGADPDVRDAAGQRVDDVADAPVVALLAHRRR